MALAVFAALAGQCVPGHSAATLAAIAQTESGMDPLTILDNTTRTSRRFADLPSAVRETSSLISAGHSVDVGLMQINSRNFPGLGLSVEAAFDSCTSLRSAVRVLRDTYAGGETERARQVSLRQAISAYNTGSPTRGFTNGYVKRVADQHELLIPTLQSMAGAADVPDQGGPKLVVRPRQQRSVSAVDALHPAADYPAPGPSSDSGSIDALHPAERN